MLVAHSLFFGHVTRGATRFLFIRHSHVECRTVQVNFCFQLSKLHWEVIRGASERKISRQSKKEFPHDYTVLHSEAFVLLRLSIWFVITPHPPHFWGCFPGKGLGTNSRSKIEKDSMLYERVWLMYSAYILGSGGSRYYIMLCLIRVWIGLRTVTT